MIDKALHYCRSALQNVSRSFALTIPLVEKNILVPILVGYLEARIMDSFEDEGVAPAKERVRHIRKVLQVIQDPDSRRTARRVQELVAVASDLVANPHYLDLAKNMGTVLDLHRTMDPRAQLALARWLGTMGEGMEKYLGKSIQTFADLDDYCYYVGGTVGALLTELVAMQSTALTPGQHTVLQRHWNDFGLFLQKVNIIRDFRHDLLAGEKLFWPREVFAAQGISPKEALLPVHQDRALAALDQMVQKTQHHAPAVREYIRAIPADYPGFRNSSIINFLLGEETLARVRGNPDVFYGEPVKVERACVDRILADPWAQFCASGN